MTKHCFSKVFTQWAAQSDLQLTDEVYQTARFALLDTLGCMVLGYDEAQPRAAYQAALVSDANGSIVPIGGGAKVSLLNAAIINGARAHALDYDDYELSGSSHPSSPIFSALFALAKQQNYTIQELCDAWVVGYESVVWLGEVLGYSHYDIGWHSTSTLGPIGTAAATAKLLGLNEEQMANAIAIATSSSAGSKLQFGFGVKAVHAGIAAKAGLQATLLAQAGLTANQSVWEGNEGFQTLYGTTESKGFDATLENMELGRGCIKYPVIRKLWPSCAYTQRPIAAAIALHPLIDDVRQIESISYTVAEPFRRVASFTQPTNDAEARFSIPYCLSVPLIEGAMRPDDYRDDYFSDDLRQSLTSLVQLNLYGLPEGDPGDIGPTTPEMLTVTMKDGTVHEKQMLFVPGGIQDPMTDSQLRDKLQGCGCDMSVIDRFSDARLDENISETGLLNLEYQPDVDKQPQVA